MSKADEFIKAKTRIGSNAYWDKNGGDSYFSWLTPDQAREAVEIAREEMYEWLSENLFNYFEARMSMFEMCLDDLKQAMKDE